MDSCIFERGSQLPLSFPQQDIQRIYQSEHSSPYEKKAEISIIKSSKSIKKTPKQVKQSKKSFSNINKINAQIEKLSTQLMACLNLPSIFLSSTVKGKLFQLSETIFKIHREEVSEAHQKDQTPFGFVAPTIRTNEFYFEDLIEESDRNEDKALSDDLIIEKKSCDPSDYFISYCSDPQKTPEGTFESDELDFRATEPEEMCSEGEHLEGLNGACDLTQWKVSEYLKRGKIKYPGDMAYQTIIRKILDIYTSHPGPLVVIETATQKRYIPQTMALFGNALLEGYFPELEILKSSNKPFYDRVREFVKEKIKGKQQKTNKDGKAVKDARITKIEQMKKLFRDPNTINKFLKQLFIQFFQSEDLIWLKAILDLSHAKPEGKIWFIMNKWSIEKVCLDEMGRGDFDPVFLPFDGNSGEILDEKRHQFFSQLINSINA